MFQNFIDIVTEGLFMDGTGMLLLWIAVALGFSTLCWWICTHYTKLWNKRYNVKSGFHVICSISAIITFFTVLSYIGLKNMKLVAERMVEEWEYDVVNDGDLQNESFIMAYEAVADSGLEKMDGYPSPFLGGNFIPMEHEETRLLVSSIYAGNACDDFHREYPFLGWFLKTDKGVPTELIAADQEAFFKKRYGFAITYPLERGFNLGVRHISNQLQKQTPRIVSVTRLWLVLVFLIIQLIPFGIIGFLAYKDLFRHTEEEEKDNNYSDKFDFDNI